MRESSWYSCLSEYLGFLCSPTLEGGVGVKLDVRNSGALWLFNPTLPPTPPPTKKERKPLGAQAHP